MERKFNEFSEFGESDKPMKYELGSILRFLCLIGSGVAHWSLTQEGKGLSNLLITSILSLNLNSVKSFREYPINSNT